ncbi:hypothetical protein [Mycoplasma marinum]|uniref:hypothetical protein n=1 Tax=Mycoplasma marinum TaxID=1937190 RepID=UPI00103B21C6|nr:hypothetical protein [Mycoplasma marinum]
MIKNNRQYNYNYSPQLSVCISITIIIYSCYFGLIDLSKNKNKAEHDFSEKYDGNEFYKLKLNYSKIEITNNILFLKGKVLKKDVYKKVCKVENINLSLPCLIINVFLYASSIIILIFINTLPSEGNEHLYPILVLTALWSLTTIIFMLLSFKSAYFLPVYFTFKKRGGLWLVLNFFSKNNLPIFKSLNNTLYDIHNKTEFKVKNNKELLVKFSNKDQIGIISKNNNIDWQLIGQNTYIIKYEDTMDVFKIISIITLSIFKGGV